MAVWFGRRAALPGWVLRALGVCAGGTVPRLRAGGFGPAGFPPCMHKFGGVLEFDEVV